MSVDAKELRLGNFVLFNPIKEVYDFCQVKVINPKNVVVLHKGLELQLFEMEFQPIPLTKEILEKCGFELQPQRISIYVNGRIKLWLGSNGVIAYLMHEDKNESFWIANPVQNLHQLQNLYFALTGTEINLTL